jgi:hypothetical protein
MAGAFAVKFVIDATVSMPGMEPAGWRQVLLSV